MTTPLAVPDGDPAEYQRLARTLVDRQVTLSAHAAAVAALADGLATVWQSRPSSPRAEARLLTCAALLREWAGRCGEAVAPVARYATALDAAQQAVRGYNAVCACGPKPAGPIVPRFTVSNGVPVPVYPAPSTPAGGAPDAVAAALRGVAEARLAELAVEEVSCATSLLALLPAASVPARLEAADALTGAPPPVLRHALGDAVDSADGAELAAVLHELAAGKNDPDVLAGVLGGLDEPTAARLAQLVHGPTAVLLTDLVGLLLAEGRPVPRPLTRLRPPAGPERYTVRYGDTLSRLADWHGTTVEELLRLNPALTDPDLLLAGAVIRVPRRRAGRAGQL